MLVNPKDASRTGPIEILLSHIIPLLQTNEDTSETYTNNKVIYIITTSISRLKTRH